MKHQVFYRLTLFIVKIRKISLRHGSEAPWDMSYMKIRVAGEEYTFTANQAINSRGVDLLPDSGDNQVALTSASEGKLDTKPPLPKATQQNAQSAVSSARKMDLTNYEVQIKTADDMGAGTDDSVYITLFGTSGDLASILLNESATNKNPFERGQLDRFFLNDVDDVGNVVLFDFTLLFSN
jgi:hypothetical protein